MLDQPLTLDSVLAWSREALLGLWQLLISDVGLTQIIAVAGAAVLGWLLTLPLKVAVRTHFPGGVEGTAPLPRFGRSLVRSLPPLGAALGTAAAREGLHLYGHDTALATPAMVLLVASAAIVLGSSVIASPFWRRGFVVLAVITSGLHVFGILDPVLGALDSVGMDLGEARVTLLTLGKAALLLAVFVRLGVTAAGFVERRLADVKELTPSTRVLLSKTARIGFYVLAVLLALGSVGIDLTALTVFSGAVGVGVGFGLRNVFANLISGLILLLDKSIKPGDVIEIGGVYGWITQLRGRFVSVITRDGKEYLIPNEDLITSQVVNWSFSDSNVRLKVPVGVSYGTDVSKALELMVEAATGVERVLHFPKPIALFMEFGDSSLNLELRVWIRDPQNGVSNITSDINLAIYDAFNENGVTIPFPQRDVHIIPQDGPKDSDAPQDSAVSDARDAAAESSGSDPGKSAD